MLSLWVVHHCAQDAPRRTIVSVKERKESKEEKKEGRRRRSSGFRGSGLDLRLDTTL